ncbi:MAG: hypothetical protein MZU95_15515 [Desulfomicrobium escambiense]|nr:hypothetical protein [Desulfomicrobium escambiense]
MKILGDALKDAGLRGGGRGPAGLVESRRRRPCGPPGTHGKAFAAKVK